MADSESKTRHFWERQVDGDGKPTEVAGSDLAALRRGAGRDAGDVPEMWRFYTTLQHDGRRLPWLKAEHAALTLYGIHQQSKHRPMHVAGIGLGAAMRALRSSGKYSEEAIDRRFTAAATATSFGEVCLHLRGLVTQLRGIDQPVDYTRLYQDLIAWQDPTRVASVRRVWGRQYFTAPKKTSASDDNTVKGSSAGKPGSRPLPRQPHLNPTAITVQESL
ncbi:type I-E CRISPR-associated protein Cse2/CasB [Solwaraspora sp. WMMD406]|uniref:type I-E CRISPR-associated protein Cse2/CasB n=1 Tax=Solwaraspora sp. WMMD406 TaxID=3016095 RepID=UPI002415C441|nr:type I-E CRISPR-associated protein Cse2/CasB [Solwaraspora sp. WMMD406]MDG4768645.1 type I-E CRISPR-associated protein Cse2/CasB [Solwaraspora sp. WMMD406]